MALSSRVLLACLGLTRPVLSQSVDGSKHNNSTAGLPASYFTATTTAPVAALQSAAAKASVAAKNATYPINANSGAKRVTIHRDWTDFSEVSNLRFTKSLYTADQCIISQGAAFVWVADMDVDCDGTDY